MARTDDLTNFLTDVATSIKTKLKDDSVIPANQFDTKIMEIETVGNYQDKSTTINSNGSYNLLPDTTFDAMSSVSITVNVPTQQINNQNKTITQNGVYTADSGYTGLGTVTVNVSGGSSDVKLFDTVEHMQADTNPQEGDLAVVYREEIQPVTEESEFSSCIFPNTVVLDEAFTDSIYGSFRSTGDSSFDGMVDMSSSSFRFDGWGDSEVRIQYTSNDGITYTRTDGGEELQEFGTTIKWEPHEEFNDVIGKFMKIGGNYFDGMYEYTTSEDNWLIGAGQRISYMYPDNLNDVVYWNRDTLNKLTEYTLLDAWQSTLYFNLTLSPNKYFGIDVYDVVEGYGSPNTKGIYSGYRQNVINIIIENGVPFIGVASTVEEDIEVWHYQNNSIEKYIIYSNQLSHTSVNNTDMYYKEIKEINFTNWICTKPVYLEEKNSATSTPVFLTINNGVSSYTVVPGDLTVYPIHPDVTRYFDIKSQLNATGDFVYEKTFYGKNGVEDGTLATNVSNSFADANAKVYAQIQGQYDTMQPRVLTDQDRTIDKNIQIIPVKSDGTPLLDTSNVTNMSDMFASCNSLTSTPQLDTSNVTNMFNMFNGCASLTTIPLLNTSKVTNMSNMFNKCASLTTIPLLDTSNVTNMSNMFYGCSDLTTIPLLNTSKVTNMSYMFLMCSNLTTIPLLDTSNVTDMTCMFSGCNSLTSIPQLNASSATRMNDMFLNCSSLSNESLNNILAMCIGAKNVTTKTLKNICLTSEQAAICQSLSNWSAFVSAGWSTGY